MVHLVVFVRLHGNNEKGWRHTTSCMAANWRCDDAVHGDCTVGKENDGLMKKMDGRTCDVENFRLEMTICVLFMRIRR